MIDQQILKDLKGRTWYKIYAGNWSLLSLTQFAEQYTDILDLEGVKFCKHCVLIYKDGACSGFIPEEEKVEFSQHVAKLYTADPTKIDALVAHFRSQVDVMLAYCQAEKGKKFNLEKYEDFWKRIDDYYTPHILNKWVVESLEPAILEKYLEHMQEVRLYSEPVFKRTEELMEQIGSQIAEETGKDAELVLCASKAEILAYWRGEALPDDSILQERRQYSAVLRMPGMNGLYAGKDAQVVEEAVVPSLDTQAGVIKGVTAYPGKAKGVVRIVLDPTKADHFQEGDILVAGMTRPEYLALMKKASAFVTDSGGILSHAAIVARELKKPCVIGTQIATKVLKDGDVVEVDADTGTVRKV